MNVDLQADGVALVRGALAAAECSDIIRLLADARSGRSGGTRRLLESDWCQSIARLVRDRLPALSETRGVAVQCTYFEKSTALNWLVPLHQDLATPVMEQRVAPGFSVWPRKEDGIFVQPPVRVLEQLVAVRLHLDPCSSVDGPLQVVPGSHALGVLNPNNAALARESRGTFECVAGVGDALLMRPLLLHASSKASGTSMRRVLHFLFGPPELPSGIAWRIAV